MAKKGRKDFCVECRKETEYLLERRYIVKNIRSKDYLFGITAAVCAECGGEMSIPGLMDKNVQEIDEQYRAAEGLVSADDIEKLMKIYKFGKAPLYNPIDDARFALVKGTEDALTDHEKRVIDLVVNTFGVYGGKVLEKITHNESPWLEARKGYGDNIPSSELLTKERIMKYYTAVNQKYGVDTEEGLRAYIYDMLSKAS